MVTINLRTYYPHYESDEFVEVTDEIFAELRQWARDESNYLRKRRRHGAQYSLDYGDEIERSVANARDSPCEIYERKVLRQALRRALFSLPDRIYRHCICGLSKAKIARTEKVSSAAVRKSVERGLREMQMVLSNLI